MFADRLFWNDDSLNLRRSFILFVQIWSDETATSLKSSALIAQSVHAMLLIFSKRYKTKLIHSAHPLRAFLPGETKKREAMAETEMKRLQQLVHVYSVSLIPDSEV